MGGKVARAEAKSQRVRIGLLKNLDHPEHKSSTEGLSSGNGSTYRTARRGMRRRTEPVGTR